MTAAPRDLPGWTTADSCRPDAGRRLRRSTWQRWWARHLVASLERRLERDACRHDGRSTCSVCRLVAGLGFPLAAAGSVERHPHAA